MSHWERSISTTIVATVGAAIKWEPRRKAGFRTDQNFAAHVPRGGAASALEGHMDDETSAGPMVGHRIVEGKPQPIGGGALQAPTHSVPARHFLPVDPAARIAALEERIVALETAVFAKAPRK